MSELPTLRPPLSVAFNSTTSPNFAFFDQRKDVTVVWTGAFDMVNGKLDVVLVADFNHFVGFNKVKGQSVFRRRRGYRVVPRRLLVRGASVPA